MPYKSLQQRREHYKKNKDKINAKRREYGQKPEVKKKKSEVDKKWRENNYELSLKRNRECCKNYDIKCKKLVFEHYGKKCSCCGEKEMMFLTIDHINGGGEKHRKKIGRKIYRWLVINNFPDGFKTLCFNCNWGKHINGGICPHKQK